MSHPHDPQGEQEEHDWVARLLAETPPETMPDHVAARLDATLADLTEAAHTEREASHLTAETAPTASEAARAEFQTARTAAHPERSLGRVVRAALAMAAAIVVIAGGALMSTRLSPPTGFSSSGDAGTAADSGGARASTPESAPSGTDDLGAQAQSSEVLDLTRTGFAAQVTAALRAEAAGGRLRSPLPSDGQPKFRADSPSRGCAPATPAGVDQSLPALLEGRQVVLQVSPLGSDRQLVRAVACDGTTLASASIPRP